jgi:signal peptidase
LTPEAPFRVFLKTFFFSALILALIFISLFAYARVWPPMVVVESGSMAHSDVESALGVIDTGDFVLVQALGSPSDVRTYVESKPTGYQTYSGFGDVLVFRVHSRIAGLFIHRAMVFVTPNSSGGVDVPSLVNRQSDEWRGTYMNGTAAATPVGLKHLTLLNVQSWDVPGGASRNITYDLSTAKVSGVLTKGDHNSAPDGWGPIPVSQILGKARGEIPWFGLVKLTLFRGPTGCCDGWGDSKAAKNSWDGLLVVSVTLIGLLVLQAPIVTTGRKLSARLSRREKQNEDEQYDEHQEPPT